MNRDAVLELRDQVMSSHDLPRPSVAKRGGSESVFVPPTELRLQVGYSAVGRGNYQLELRVQTDRGPAFERARQIVENEARGEGVVRVVQRIHTPSRKALVESSVVASKQASRCRPLILGASVSHVDDWCGTLGCFILDENEDVCIMSNSHVLAKAGEAQRRDRIIQPGRPDLKNVSNNDVIGELAGFCILRRGHKSSVDSAIAKLVDGIEMEGNSVPVGYSFSNEGAAIEEPIADDELDQLFEEDKVVAKIGRTTGYTEGLVTAAGLRDVHVTVGTVGNVIFDNVFEITWNSNRDPFTSPGDSGSVVFSGSSRVAFGLHFAAGTRKEKNGMKTGVSYSCNLADVMKFHNVTWL